jgi:uncharacterized protein (DUF4415 family)
MTTEQGHERKRVRGKGKNPAKMHVNLRVPADVLEFYRRTPGYTKLMRAVLTAYARGEPMP